MKLTAMVKYMNQKTIVNLFEKSVTWTPKQVT